MAGLVLKLGPRERVLINGAVVENVDRRSRLAVMTPNANILRLTDHDSRACMALATDAVLDEDYYKALKALRSLLPREDRLLSTSFA